MAKFQKRVFVITSHTKYNDGSERSYLLRICSDQEFAEELLQTEYDDATERHQDKYGTVHCEPEWLDEKHYTLRTKNITGGVVSYSTISLNAEWEENIYSKCMWL